MAVAEVAEIEVINVAAAVDVAARVGAGIGLDAMAELDAARREQTLEDLRAMLARHQTPDGVSL